MNQKRASGFYINAIQSAFAISTLLSLAACNGSDSSSTPQGASCNAISGSHLLATFETNSGTVTALAPRAQLSGHLLKAAARSTETGKLDESKLVPITVSLGLADAEGLAREIQDIYTPGNPKFHQFLKPADFHARFGASAAQTEAVKSYLEEQGFSAVTVDGGGQLVHAMADVGTVNRTFETELHEYKDARGRSFHAPTIEPTVPSGLGIEGVHGLQNLSFAHTHNHQAPAKPADATSHVATGPSGGFSPTDVRTAYNIPSTLDGSGQTLGLFELDGYATSDITAYESKFGLTATPLENVLVDNATGTPGGGQAEVTLDIELMIAVAPKATKIMVYEGPNSDQGMLDVMSKIANDNVAKSISTSWGVAEDSSTQAFMASENTILAQMAAQGQTIYSAAGDNGAQDDGSTLSIDDPSGQPYMTAVGGTSLTTNSAGAISKETTWTSGGGGISAVWTIPTWQAGLATSGNLASATMRNIPDVALNADGNTGYSIYTGGSWGVWGGTSCAAPLWAAFTALVNQNRAATGLNPIGFVTPTLYAIGRSTRGTTDFHDIADGSTNGHYPAVTGYDDATGWGSFDAANLIQDLTGSASSTSASTGTDPITTPVCGS